MSSMSFKKRNETLTLERLIWSIWLMNSKAISSASDGYHGDFRKHLSFTRLKVYVLQIWVVRSCFIRCVHWSVLLRLRSCEVHLTSFGVIRDAARAARAAHAGHWDSVRWRWVARGLHRIYHRPLIAIPTVTAPTQPDGHHQTCEHLQDPTDEAQHQAVSYTNVGGCGEDGGHDVSVPRHWDDGEDPWDEDE